MAIASTFLILGTEPNFHVCRIPLCTSAFLAGILILVGIAGVINETGNIAFDQLDFENVYAKFIFVGFLINAGCYPFVVVQILIKCPILAPSSFQHLQRRLQFILFLGASWVPSLI